MLILSFRPSLGCLDMPPSLHAKHPILTRLQVIGVSGQGSADEGQYGLLGTLVSNITASIPGSYSEPLSYPKLELQKAALTNAGVENLNAYLIDFHNQCPTTPIVLAGYSAGGVISCKSKGSFFRFVLGRRLNRPQSILEVRTDS